MISARILATSNKTLYKLVREKYSIPTMKPICVKQRKTSTACFPNLPNATTPISEKDPPPSFCLAYRSLMMQKYDSKKLKTIAESDKSQPPFLKFLGEYRIPMSINPFTSEK